MWVQLLRSQQIEKAGVSRTYHPGDWVEVGRQTALRWVTDGAARLAKSDPLTDSFLGCGLVVIGDIRRAAHLRKVLPSLTLEIAEAPALTFARTALWDSTLTLRPELLPVGFKLLDTWEVAAPIVSYDQLATHIGTDAARERTQAVIRDLRVPLYEPRLLFIRRCRAGEALIAAWSEERASGDDDQLCLLRALYRVKPLLCALPTTWIKQAA